MITTDISRAAETDRIEDCVNYRTVSKNILNHTEKAERFTVEALAEDIAGICLKEEGVRKVLVRVEKPHAVRFAESVGVEIVRPKKG